jgi:hypothetical protein
LFPKPPRTTDELSGVSQEISWDVKQLCPQTCNVFDYFIGNVRVSLTGCAGAIGRSRFSLD